MSRTLIFFTFAALIFSNAHAWSERGHHLVGFAAAYNVSNWVTNKDDEALIGDAWIYRAHMMGHLNNVPDVSWKGVANKTVLKLNGPTHYFDPELLFPKLPFDEVTKKLLDLPTEWKDLIARYPNANNPYTGKPLEMYWEVGSAPYRIQDLQRKMVLYFKCAKSKEGKTVKWKDRLTGFPMNGETIVDNLKCDDKMNPNYTLMAAFAVGGVLGHFAGDLAQPYHNSIDYDGFATGQGGIHGYFETEIVAHLPRTLESIVAQKLANKANREKWAKLYAADFKTEITQTIFRLIQDSRNTMAVLQKLDKKDAFLQAGDVVPFGIRFTPKDKKAKRRPASEIAKKSEWLDLAADRIARGAFILSYVWHSAWLQGGKPRLEHIDKESTTYPLDVGFLKPDYAD